MRQRWKVTEFYIFVEIVFIGEWQWYVLNLIMVEIPMSPIIIGIDLEIL